MSTRLVTMVPAASVCQKLGRPNPYGKIQMGVSLYGIGHPRNGIYQRERTVKGKLFTKKIQFYPYVITHTAGQNANRTKFADAIAGWQGLTTEQREVYNERVKNKNLSGYNLYIREYMLS